MTEIDTPAGRPATVNLLKRTVGVLTTFKIPYSYSPIMKNLGRITNRIIRDLKKKEQVREEAIPLTREINRRANDIVNGIHNQKDVERDLIGIKKLVKQLNRLLSNYPDLRHGGFTTNALQEYTEAAVFQAIVSGTPIPSPSDLEIDNTPYALGLGDVVGELRRLVLNKIIESDLKAARQFYKDMEQLTDILFKFHFPDGMIPMRRKQDIARSILEKTQGELAVALTTNAIKNNL